MKIRSLIFFLIFTLSAGLIYSESYSTVLERVIAKRESHLPDMFKDSEWRSRFIERLDTLLEKELISKYSIVLVLDSLNNVQLNAEPEEFSKIFHRITIDTDLSLKRGKNAAEVRLKLRVDWKRLKIEGKNKKNRVFAQKNKALQNVEKLQKEKIRNIKIPVTKGEEHRTNQEIPGSEIVGRK